MDALSPATNLSFGSVSEPFGNGAAGGVKSFEHTALLTSAMWAIVFPNVIFSGLGRKLYFSAGIISAVASRFFEYSSNTLRTLAVSGLAAASCARASMGVTKQTATRQINRFIPVLSFEITRSSQDTTNGRPIQAEVARGAQFPGTSSPGQRQTPGQFRPPAEQVPVVVSRIVQTPELPPRILVTS